MDIHDKILVSKEALYKVLTALNGPAHYVRELQVTRGPLIGDDNPINILVKEYNEDQLIKEVTIASIDIEDNKTLIGIVVGDIKTEITDENIEECFINILTGKTL